MPNSSNNPVLQLPSSEQADANGTVAVTGVRYTDSFAQQNAGSLYLGISDSSGWLDGFYPAGNTALAAPGSGTDSIVFVGSYTDVAAILSSLTYAASGTAASDQIRFDIWNQAGIETTGTLPVTIAASAPAADPTWTGAISSDWNTPGNWSGGAVPVSGDTVTIPAGTTNAPALANASLTGETVTLAGASVALTDVTLNGSWQGSGTIDAAGTLTIGAAGSVAASDLVITGTAETIVNNGQVLAPGGTLDLTNGYGATDAPATFINDGSLAAQDLALKSVATYPNGSTDPFAGGPDWLLVNDGTIAIPDNGSFDMNGTIQGGVVAFAGAGTLALEQGMAFAGGAAVSGFGPGDQIMLLDPAAGQDASQLQFASGTLDILSGGSLVQAIPMTGSLGLGNFELATQGGPSGFATISYEPGGASTAMIEAPATASVAQGGTVALNDVAISPGAPTADYDAITITANTGTLFMNGASGSGTHQVSISGVTGQQADAALASLSYVAAPGTGSDDVTVTVVPPAPVEFTRAIPITITAGNADPPATVIAASDADPVELASNTVITATAGDHMIFIGGTGDTLTATGGTETVQAFQGHNTITTGSGNDSISFAGSGNTIDAGGGSNTLADSGSLNTIIMPGAGQGMDDIFGYVLQNGDLLDFRTALAATTWNGASATLGNYLHVTAAGSDAIVSLSQTSGGAPTQIADLRDAGQIGLSGLLAHALT